MPVISNILDEIHESLPRDVWDHPASPEPKLKSQHGKWIRATVERVLSGAGYTGMQDWLSLVLTGSLTTFQYDKHSDCDVSLFVDSVHFPEWSRAEMIGLMVKACDGLTLPGTPYQMQMFVVAKGITKEDLYRPGLRSGWDIDNHRWIEPPDPHRVHNVEQEMNSSYAWALECADKMDRLLRYEPDKAVMFWHAIHQRRRRDQMAGKGDYSDSNIVYKFLANRGLFPRIEEVSGEHIASGLDTQDFFSEAQGGGHQPLQPLMAQHVSQDPDHQAIYNTMQQHFGPFDRHIETSIPDFRSNSLDKVHSLLQQPGGRLLDIAGSTGSFGKALSQLSNGRWQTDNLDPNEAMAAHHNLTPVQGAGIVPAAFGESFEDNGRVVPQFATHEPYDAVHESMGFQFMSPERMHQLAEAKRLLKPGGLFLSEQKFHTDNEEVNELAKDRDFKAHYYNTDQLERKNKQVGFQGQGPMTDNLVHHRDYEHMLGQHFQHVAPYWDSGNFKGYAASDDPDQINSYMAGLKRKLNHRTAHDATQKEDFDFEGL